MSSKYVTILLAAVLARSLSPMFACPLFFVVLWVGLAYHILECDDYVGYEWFVVVVGCVRGSLESVLDSAAAYL